MNIRSWLYGVAKYQGDVNAAKNGKVGKRTARRAAGKMTGRGPGLVVGPLGFEPRTDGLKVSGSSLKTAPKQQGNCRETAQNSREAAGFRPPFRYKI